jgi:hypothetical protein
MYTFAFLLVVAPMVVRLHGNTMAEIDDIRKAAQTVNTQILVEGCETAVHQWVAAYKGAVCKHASPGHNIKKQAV